MEETTTPCAAQQSKKHVTDKELALVLKDVKYHQGEGMNVTAAAKLVVEKYKGVLELSKDSVLRWVRLDGVRSKNGRRSYLPPDSDDYRLFRDSLTETNKGHCNNTPFSMRQTVWKNREDLLREKVKISQSKFLSQPEFGRLKNFLLRNFSVGCSTEKQRSLGPQARLASRLRHISIFLGY